MSLNSLQDDMSRRAASMAAMARRANNPQEIQAIQQSLVAGVQNGSIQPYVGIPLIQDLTKKLAEATAKMAQTVAGAGMPQPPADGPPIAQQVMQQAAQESQGVEALPSNLPQSYAGGGIIAFEGGGQVERYQNAGYTGESERKRVEEAMAKLRTYGLRQRQQDPQGYIAAETAAKEAQAALSNAERSITGGPVGAMGQSMGLPMPPAVAPTATPAAMPYDPATATRRSQYTNAPIPNTPGAAPAAPSAAPGAAIPGASSFKMPTFAGMTMPSAPASTNYQTLLGDTEAKTKRAGDTANRETLEKLESFDEPGNAAREEKYSKREAAQAKNSAMDRALNIMNLGFGIAGSKERTLAGALGNEGREGIRDLLRGEAANRAALDKLDDARDNFEQQKTAAKKGNYQAAQAAKERAIDNVYKYQDLTMKAAHYGSNEALQRYHTEMQGNFQQASLDQSGKLGIGHLDIQNRQLQQHAAAAAATLAMQNRRIDAMNATALARQQQVRVNASNTFDKEIAPGLKATYSKDPSKGGYGPNWETGKDPRSLEAQMKFKQTKQAHVADALSQHDLQTGYARQADALLGD